MPRPVGGNSPFGQMINKIGSSQDGLQIGQVKYATGEIISFQTSATDAEGSVDANQDGLYRFKVRLSSGMITEAFLPLSGQAAMHARNLGGPGDYIGNKCQISYEGSSANRGRILTIEDDFVNPMDSSAWAQINIKGAAFAPPGGMV